MTTINYVAALPVLRHARDRIRIGWTRLAWARDADGERCFPNEMAVAWSVKGAITNEQGCAMAPGFDEAMAVICDGAGIEPSLLQLNRWNDAPGRTQAEVLALFDRAIAECEEKAR